MRLVVGPLPASVYWRRRALVLGGVVLVVALIVYSCGTSGTTAGPGPGSSSSPVALAPSEAPSSTPDVVAPVVEVTPTGTPEAPVTDPNACTDQELSVTPVAEKTTTPRGSTIQLKLLIKNTSQRTCTRDVGADQQELYIVLGTHRIWSSDDCDGPTGTDLRSFPPGHERSYTASWNGKSSSSCSTTAKRTPDGPTPEAGDYQLFGRVGTDLSEPVTIKLT